VDATYFTGGRTTLNDALQDDLQQNWRVGGTLSYAPGSRIPTKSVSIVGYEAGKRRLVRQLAPEHVPAP
jgi:hypothetical protein